MVGVVWRTVALWAALSGLTSGCLLYFPPEGSDDGGRPDAGSDAGSTVSLALDGGRRQASWRDGVAPIVNDAPGWYVPAERERVLYPVGQRHSPLTAAMAQRLRAVALHGQGLHDNVFMKVGDSITASGYFMGCFEGDVNGAARSWEFNILLDGRTPLADAIFHFRSATLDPSTPFSRASQSARVGESAGWVVSGAPSPLDVEFEALRPQFATVMYGTNDLNAGGRPDLPLEQKLNPYAEDLLAIVDRLLQRGVVPVLSTIPPRTRPAEYVGLAEVMNAVVRAIAQGRQVPLVDFHGALLPLRDFGLSGDGVHPNLESYNSACHFDPRGLGYGYNVRNLVTLEALERAMRVVVDGAPGLDDTGQTLDGAGTESAPYLIGSLPFSDLRNVGSATSQSLSSYGCENAASGTGRELVYRLTVTQPTLVRAAVVQVSAPPNADGGVPDLGVGLHLLREGGSAPTCVKSVSQALITRLSPGSYLFSVDRDGATALPPSGEYVFVVVPCAADDVLCAAQASQ